MTTGSAKVLAKAPNGVIIVCGTVFGLAVLACLTILTVTGSSTTDIFRLLNLVMNGVGVLFGSGAFLYSAAAAKRSDDVASTIQNGELTDRIHQVLLDHDRAVHGLGSPSHGSADP